MLSKMTPNPLRPARNPAPPPDHLEQPEADLWTAILHDFAFNDPASLALLEEALSARQRARRCRQAIDRKGETVLDRFDQTNQTPSAARRRARRPRRLFGRDAHAEFGH